MLFNFRKVSKERKENAQAWVNEIKDFLNTNQLIEDWHVILSSGFLGYGPGRFRCNGDVDNSSLVIHTRKNDELMDVHLNLFATTEEIQECLELAIQERTKNSTDSYYIGGPREKYYHEVTLGKSHPDEWTESYQSEWIAKNSLVRKARKYLNKNKIEIPSDVSYFDINENSIKLVITTRTSKINKFVDDLNKVVNVYATY